MRNPRQIWLMTILIILFLVLAVFHNRIVLRDNEQQLSQSQQERLMLLGQIILPDLERNLVKALGDPFFIYSLANDNGAARILLMDQDGVVLMDSLGRARQGQQIERLGIQTYELVEVLEGVPKLSIPYRDLSDTPVRSIFLPYHDSSGFAAGIVQISIKISSPANMGDAAVTSVLLKVFGAVMAMMMLYIVIRSLKPSYGVQQGGGETGAMIESFHGLVRELKEKEQELEKLKKEAERRAADVESYNESILQSVASGVITFDRDQQITTFNPAAERILGIPSQMAVGSTCEELFGQASYIDRLLQEALSRGIVISRQEFELNRKGQGHIWVGVSTSLLHNREGEIIGATFVFTDLTEIKHLQEQVELKRRLTVLGEMSAGIAHEFRNFMGTIMGFAKLISKRLDSNDPGQNMVQAITQELQAMDRLIEQLLSFGRHIELNLRPVDLESFLHKLVLHVLDQAADRPRPKLNIEIPTGIPPVALDEVLMRQAITNLLQNALEAMPNGGELRVKIILLEREVSAKGTVREILLEIGDNGEGVPSEKLDKIFLPFFTTKQKGTGMGLALVHKIVLSHNGRIQVDSMEGRGSTFRIYLPLKS
jgi:two-component system, NtrC family, nitrogen regulation sensor histidine kinase GlnL